jgi:capsular exopolysaccharide synthesis family protein
MFGVDVLGSFRLLDCSMKQMQVIKSIKTILVTNTRSFSDNSSVAADLAVMIAKSGKKVALIDANLRRPVLHKMFQLPNQLGLSDILQNHRAPLSVLHIRENKNLAILTTGGHTISSFEIFNSEKMHDSMRILKDEFDRIIIHGPPFFFTEAASIATQVDGVVLLIHPGHNKTDTSRVIIEKFQRSGATVIGVVMREQPKNQAKQSAFIDRLLTFDKHIRQHSL